MFDEALSRDVEEALEDAIGTHLCFIDAGSRLARRPGAEAIVVKLAVLERLMGENEVVVERLLHPVARDDSGTWPPYLVAPGGERARQGLSYLVEIASLLALLQDRSVGVVVRHGPLIQQIHHLLSRAYDVDEDVLNASLGYAGLDPRMIHEVYYESKLCNRSGRANIGLAVASVLARLVENAARAVPGVVVAGVVEDVSRSRVLIASLLSELIVQTLGEKAEPRSIAGALHSLTLVGLRELEEELEKIGLGLSSCFCIDEEAFRSEVEGYEEWLSLATGLRSEVSSRYHGMGLSSVEEARTTIEASLLSSSLLPEYMDSELVYSLHYLGLGSVLTKPRPRLGLIGWMRIALEEKLNQERLKCHSSELLEKTSLLKEILYTYIAPSRPPSCMDLGREVGSIEPCEAAELVSVAPAIRVEYVGKEPRPLLSLVYYSSSLSLYGYPSQLLVVDKASRIHADEAKIAASLLESLAHRMQPYMGFIRAWSSRRSLG